MTEIDKESIGIFNGCRELRRQFNGPQSRHLHPNILVNHKKEIKIPQNQLRLI